MTSPASDAADAVRDARTRLRDSLDALSNHLSPGGALDLARSIVEDHEARRSAVDFVKRNPVPTALAASGLAWLGYKLLSGDDDKLADPRHEPGLTEVPGERNLVPDRATSGRQDVPHVPRITAPVPEAAPPVEPVRRLPAEKPATGVRATFARHPLLYGVVGLVTGAIAGVIAALRGGDEPALEAPSQASSKVTASVEPAASPSDRSETCAAGTAHTIGAVGGVSHRPPRPTTLHPRAN